MTELAIKIQKAFERHGIEFTFDEAVMLLREVPMVEADFVCVECGCGISDTRVMEDEAKVCQECDHRIAIENGDYDPADQVSGGVIRMGFLCRQQLIHNLLKEKLWITKVKNMYVRSAAIGKFISNSGFGLFVKSAVIKEGLYTCFLKCSMKNDYMVGRG